ncbi:NUDIX hydrolase [Streptomyces termitum]|uniref:Nudix hydrolase n=1 Tax=Streptomyces termitum TaxID=67368 RepID=A0A918T5U9_9ACTN|nr:NUDIX domain-containing protein [Streptomyces termitum]GHA98576.1 putative Nudix hydrolase [Streptomyces termitum]
MDERGERGEGGGGGGGGEKVERVDERDRVVAVVGRAEAVRRGWPHRIAVTVCRDREGRILVQRRAGHLDRFPGHYEAMSGGAVAVGETYGEAAARELVEELGVRAPVRFVVKFLSRGGLSPHWLAVHEAVLSEAPDPDPDEVAWHGWLSESELLRAVREDPFTPDTREALGRYFAAVDRAGRT